jgi:hypothetical protein
MNADYMCNPPLQNEAKDTTAASRASAPAPAPAPAPEQQQQQQHARLLQPYLTNNAETPYDTRHVSPNHSIGLGTPLYHHPPPVVPHELSAQCVDPAIIGVSQPPSLDASRARQHHLFYGAHNFPVLAADPNLRTKHRAIITNSGDMDVDRLVNPVHDDGGDQQPHWPVSVAASNHPILIADSPVSIDEVENTDSTGVNIIVGAGDDIIDVDGEGDYIIDGDLNNNTNNSNNNNNNNNNRHIFPMQMGESSATGASRSRAPATKQLLPQAEAPKKTRKKQERHRGPYTDTQMKADTAATRERRACTRCRQQKQRCVQDPADPEGDCVKCKSYSKTSRKTIHRAPCQRGKITDAILVRQGGLNLTQRWQGTDLRDVAERPFPSDVHEIEFTVTVLAWVKPLRIRVVRFTPARGDVTARIWWDSDGRRKKLELEPYCLADIHATAKDFEDYVRRNAVDAFIKSTLDHVSPFSDTVPHLGLYTVVERTYTAAWKFYQELRKPNIFNPGMEQRERKAQLFSNLFMLWFASRHTTGMSYISSEETLGMKAYTKYDSYPLYGKISLPRMIVAQFDSITHSRALQKYSRLVLKELEFFISQNSPDSWWTVYLCLFVLLHEAAYMTRDRYLHARRSFGTEARYSLPDFVEKLQSSCTLLVQYWHYYNTQKWSDPLRPQERHKSGMAMLTPEQYQLVAETQRDPDIQKQLNYRKILKQNNYKIPDDADIKYGIPLTGFDWDHHFFWISQLFEDNWTAHKTYQKETTSPVKNEVNEED